MNDHLRLLMLEAGYAAPELASRANILAGLIIEECLAICGEVYENADAMTKSKFVTESGRMLHEGMWGGAKNCEAGIKNRFGVNDE